MMKVAINGLGRVGRLVLRHLMQFSQVQVVAVNDLTDAATLAHLLQYDSVHGRPPFRVATEGNLLLLEGQRIQVHGESDPGRLPFGRAGAQVVLECTGCFTRHVQAAAHLRDGVGHVLVSAPSEDADRTIVLGVNEAALIPASDRVISAADSATHGLAFLVQVLDGAFGLDYGFHTTVRSYTSDQRILDLPHADLRLARAAALSMIPTTSPAARELGRVLPHLADRLGGLSVRVPTPDVSLVELTATLRSEATPAAVEAAFRQAAVEGPLAPYLDVLEAELVSADLVGRPASAIYDPYLTKVLGPRFVKVFAWYDNEWAYAARLAELCVHVLERARP